MIYIAIVEDDKKNQLQMVECLNKYSKAKNIKFEIQVFNNGLDFVEGYEPHFDVVFMDIEMPIMNGMDAAKKIRQKDGKIEIIFTTILTNYAVEGYIVDAFDYILKPINYTGFEIKLDRLIKKITMSHEKFFVSKTKGGEIRNIQQSTIFYFVSDNHYVNIYTSNGDYIIRDTISNVEKNLDNKSFVRCGKSYLVNLRHVTKVSESTITLVNGHTVSLSRSYRKSFLDSFTKFFTQGGAR